MRGLRTKHNPPRRQRPLASSAHRKMDTMNRTNARRHRGQNFAPLTSDIVAPEARKVIKFWSGVPSQGGPASFVYLMQEIDGGMVKMGWAYQPLKRLRELQCGNPRDLRVIAAIHGGPLEESELHGTFKGARERGEWFRNDEELIRIFEFIAKAQIDERCNPRPVRDDRDSVTKFNALLVKAMFPPRKKVAA